MSCTNVYQWLWGACGRLGCIWLFSDVGCKLHCGYCFCKVDSFILLLSARCSMNLAFTITKPNNHWKLQCSAKTLVLHTAQTYLSQQKWKRISVHAWMYAYALHASHRENSNAGVYLCWEPYKDVVYEVQVQCGSCLALIKLSCATFWREPLPPPFCLSLLASLSVSSQCSVAHPVSLIAVTMFPRVILKGSMIKKSQQKKRTSPCNYKERFFVLDTQDLKYSENRPGVRKRLETKRFIWSSSLRDRLHNTIVICYNDNNWNKAEINQV